MVKFFEFVGKAKTLPDKYNVVWQNDEDTKIPIIDGKVQFFDRATGAYYSLYVRQVKGRGVADADKLTKLSEKHFMVIRRCMEIGWEAYTSEQILKILEKWHEKHNETFKANGFKRTISELFRRGVFRKSNDMPPKYILETDVIDKVMETGVFT